MQKIYILLMMLVAGMVANAQTQSDKPVIFTGNNTTDRRVQNVGNAVHADDLLNAQQTQRGSAIYALVAGSANSIDLTTTPSVLSSTSGQVICFNPLYDNTGAAQLNLNGLGAVSIQSGGNQLAGGEIKAGRIVKVLYTGTAFEIL